MTVQKHLKSRVRARMQKTGERYTTARRHVLRQALSVADPPSARYHFAGNIPATTALRTLLAHLGIQNPATKQPFSEAMLFGIAGGIGIGVFAFFYERANVSSLFIAGRHRWEDDLAYLQGACERLGVSIGVTETNSAKQAAMQLAEALETHGPCIAWVDMAHLPHRALPKSLSGGGYHVVSIYRIEGDQAIIGDLTDTPISISLADLASARSRIKKQKHRLLWLQGTSKNLELSSLVHPGLRACHQGFGGSKFKNYKANFSLEAIRTLAERMHGSKHKERWERVFARGPRLWRGLTSLYDFIEHYGTGGGLCRPLFADFFAEAADSLGDKQLHDFSDRYAKLGAAWSDIAHAALPDNVPAFREARELYREKAELTAAGADPVPVRDLWNRIAAAEQNASESFPLSDAECVQWCAELKSRLLDVYDAELAAHAALGEWLESSKSR